MKNELTKKQQEILFLLYRFRFLTRNHIQALLNHKDHKRINSWLKHLTEQEYIGRIYEQNSFIGRMTPGLYSLVLKSLKILKENRECNPAILKRITRKKDYSKAFIESYLLIADLYLWFLATKKPTTQIDLFTHNELAAYNFLPKVLPNAYLVSSRPGRKKRRYFVDVLDEIMPRFVIRQRIKRYFEYVESEEWRDNTKHPFPEILFICPNQRVEKYVHKRVILSQEEYTDKLAYFTTTIERLKAPSTDPNIWHEVAEPDENQPLFPKQTFNEVGHFLQERG